MRNLPDGHTTYVEHFPASEWPYPYHLAFTNVTVVTILNPAGEAVAIGRAFCSTKDQFNKKIGTEMATGRALKDLGV